MALTPCQAELFDELDVADWLAAPPRSRQQTIAQARATVLWSFRAACLLAADAVPSEEDVLAHAARSSRR